ncbi:hypothetical protein [Cohnella panacarvi]|uniref:hypothetical protein n=1 Tax=Cohnella panacarvi TaxID=400776 RepID=UPI0012EB6157|nr:hypothetical protein [Cohnella panacarvi]
MKRVIVNQKSLLLIDSSSSVSKVLEAFIKRNYNDNVAEFGRSAGRLPHALWGWIKGESKPELESLLWLATFLNTTIYSLVMNKTKGLKINQEANYYFKKKKKRGFIAEKVKRVLQDSLLENPPPHMMQIMEKTACSRSYLASRFPELYNQVIQRYYEHMGTKKKGFKPSATNSKSARPD